MKVIGFIGGGAMAEAIIKGLIKVGHESDKIIVSDKSAQRLNYLHDKLGVTITEKKDEIFTKAEVIILAVKPQNLPEVAKEVSNVMTSDRLIISILAGVSTATLEKQLPLGARIIRVMPNTPALVGAGTTVLTAGTKATKNDLEIAEKIFQAVGHVTVLPENMLNAVTGLSGSGPAYIYLVIEALADGGVMAGLTRDVAMKLAVDTVKGAAEMVEKLEIHPGRLKDMVTSPAGTTIYGMMQLEKAGVRGSFMEAVVKAAERAENLA